MPRLLVQIATGPEYPTRAALGLLVARTARDEGHDVDVFLAGDGCRTSVPRRGRPRTVSGPGAREHLEALASGGAAVYASGLSSKARGVSTDAAGMPVTLVPPTRLVELVLESDRVMVY